MGLFVILYANRILLDDGGDLTPIILVIKMEQLRVDMAVNKI